MLKYILSWLIAAIVGTWAIWYGLSYLAQVATAGKPFTYITCDPRSAEGLTLIASSYYPDGRVICSYLKTYGAAPQRYPGTLKPAGK